MEGGLSQIRLHIYYIYIYTYIHNSLSNVAIHTACVKKHHAGHYQLEMAITSEHLPPVAMTMMISYNG